MDPMGVVSFFPAYSGVGKKRQFPSAAAQRGWRFLYALFTVTIQASGRPLSLLPTTIQTPEKALSLLPMTIQASGRSM
jgi:hypothetical protein